jgi:hypothetical protein
MKFCDLFTYQADVSGKRKMRTFVKAAIIILAALIVLWGVACYQQYQVQQVISATKPVVFPSLTPTNPDVPTFTPEATATTVASCPTDPAEWNLVEGLPGTVYQRIEPACVYEGLERTVAFVVGITEGYSRQEVADALGFDKLPMVRLAQVTVDGPSGPVPTDVVFGIDIPPYKEWTFREDEEVAISLTLQGCFRTFTIVGNEKKNWDENGYPVVCRLSYDNESTAGVYCMGDACFSLTYPNNPTVRGYSLFGYAGDGRWVWLGNEKNAIEIDSKTMSEDRAASAELQGVGPWNRDWLEETYGLTTQPLPGNWQSLSSEENKQKLKDALKAYGSGGTSP